MSKAATKGFHVLIPAAGSGTRTGSALPKQYYTIGGKAVLRHTIEKFDGLEGLLSLRVIVDKEHKALYDDAVLGLDLPPSVYGGKTRRESVLNGLQALYVENQNIDAYVLVHDAARPFVDRENILSLLSALDEGDAATLVTPLADTIVDREYTLQERNALFAVQTPQAFRFGTLRAAHEKFFGDERFTDDAGMVAAFGEPVKLVNGNCANFKITTKGDLDMAEKLLGIRETRIGFGYDIHAFDPAPAAYIRLGGIDIPHDKKLHGHSDADVVLHALTDALLGTIGNGDIGQLFPPSDMTWKGADSAIFLAEAVRRVASHDGRIVNCDIALIAEEPKIGPHRSAMQSRIAELLSLGSDRVGLKATTAEKLGSLGRGEGISAQAVVSVSFPA